MIAHRMSGRRWKGSATHSAKILVVAAIAIIAGSRMFGTGFYGLNNYLDQGGKNVDASPEFYWDLEAKRLAKDLKAAEKLVVPAAAPDQTPAEESGQGLLSKATADADVNDFKLAIKEQRIKPPDAAKALQQHTDARGLIETKAAPLSEEFESEFSDYHRGALAFDIDKEQWA